MRSSRVVVNHQAAHLGHEQIHRFEARSPSCAEGYGQHQTKLLSWVYVHAEVASTRAALSKVPIAAHKRARHEEFG